MCSPVPEGGDFGVGRIFCQNDGGGFVPTSIFIFTVIDVHAHNAASLGEYKAHTSEQILLLRSFSLRQRRPRLRIGGRGLATCFRIIGHLARLLAFRIGLQPPADPLRQRRQLLRKIHAIPLLPFSLLAFCLTRCTERGGRLPLGRSFCFSRIPPYFRITGIR